MRQHPFVRPTLLATAIAAALLATSGPALGAPNYAIAKVLVADDQYQGESGVTPKPIYKPHETDATAAVDFWISSNERDGKAGITILKSGTNNVLSTLNVEDACIPVVGLDGNIIRQFGGCAPAGAEKHPRHPHGIDIDNARKLAYQVLEHSGLKWTADRSGFANARTTDEESGLLVVYDIADPADPKVLRGYVLGHAAEEVAVNDANGKAYVGNHEPSPTNVPCFVSVVDPSRTHAPYTFIDLPGSTQCVQGIEVDEPLNRVFGTTHIAQKMYAFNSANDTIDYSVDIRGPFNAFVASLPASARFAIPNGWVIHMHDLAADAVSHRAYQTIHTIGEAVEIEASEEEGAVETEVGITGRWVAEVDVNPASKTFRKVTILDLSNGQSVPAVPTHDAAIETGKSFDQLFVHAHFLAVDSTRKALLVSGEHTGNLGVVDTVSRVVKQVLPISRQIPGCIVTPELGEAPGAPEPHVHGVNLQAGTGTAYVSDEGEECFYESVTLLAPQQ
jgi:hypothetical protein